MVLQCLALGCEAITARRRQGSLRQLLGGSGGGRLRGDADIDVVRARWSSGVVPVSTGATDVHGRDEAMKGRDKLTGGPHAIFHPRLPRWHALWLKLSGK